MQGITADTNSSKDTQRISNNGHSCRSIENTLKVLRLAIMAHTWKFLKDFKFVR